jgi:ribosomal protein S18 acetylase RimI-like enzyme
MRVERVRDRERLERFLRHDTGLHLYSLADLDDAFWPRTTWYAALDGDEIAALCMVFTGLAPSVLIALANDVDDTMRGLLREIAPELPDLVYAHLSPGLVPTAEVCFEVEPHGLHQKMLLGGPSALDGVDTSGVVPLRVTDLDELRAFYAPMRGDGADGEYALEPYMLETRHYFGLRDATGLSSAGGVHVMSAQYGVAAIGNVATRPDARGRGLARRVTAQICRSLMGSMRDVGLNVQKSNLAAVRCYEGLGFRRVADYVEATLRRGC